MNLELVQPWDGFPHVLKTQQFSAEVLDPMMRRAIIVENAWAENGKIDRLSKPFDKRRRLRILRDEPSTRTVETFYEAGCQLGYDVREVQSGFSSQMKGESHPARIAALTQVGGMGAMRLTDVLVIRSKQEGAAQEAVKVIETAARLDSGAAMNSLPVINAGDGAGQHPTQALVDLATIWRERNTSYDHPLQDLTIVLVGDILHSRVINSLCHLLGRFEGHGIRIIFCSHPEIGPKPGLIEYLSERGISHEITTSFVDAIRQADVVYMTRVQRERFGSQDVYARVRGQYVFQGDHLGLLKDGAFVMHPLPINEDPSDPPPEIDPALWSFALDGDPRCAWARQSMRGLVVRYVLLDWIEAILQRDYQT